MHVVKLTLRDKESAQEAVRRFRKLVERSGIKKEMRVREFYEKPSEIKRRARLRRLFGAARVRRDKFFANSLAACHRGNSIPACGPTAYAPSAPGSAGGFCAISYAIT